MAISFEEAAIAWAKMFMRAEQAEIHMKELEVEKLKNANAQKS